MGLSVHRPDVLAEIFARDELDVGRTDIKSTRAAGPGDRSLDVGPLLQCFEAAVDGA